MQRTHKRNEDAGEDQRELVQNQRSLSLLKTPPAEESLPVGDEMYRYFADNANDLILSVDPGGTFTYVNKTWLETLRYGHEEALRLKLTDILRADQIDHCLDLFRRLCNGESLGVVETVFITKDGCEIPVQGTVDASYRDGRLLAIRGIFRDITHHEQAQEELLRSREWLNKTQRIAHVGSWEWDLITGAFEVSDEMYRICGLPNTHKFANVWAMMKEALHPDDLERSWAEAAMVNDGQTTFPSYRILRPDGEVRWAEFPPPDVTSFADDGTPSTIMGTIQDITERRNIEEDAQPFLAARAEHTRLLEEAHIDLERALDAARETEEALRQSEGLSKGMLETAGIGIYLSQHGRFVYVNRLLEQMTGYTNDELLGTRPIDLIHPEEREAIRVRTIESLRGLSPTAQEFKAIRKDYEVMWISERVTSIDYHGKRAVMGTLLDVTEKNQAEASALAHIKQVEAILGISAVVNQTLDLAQILQNIINEVLALTGIGAVGIYLLQEQSDQLVLKAHRGFPAKFAERVNTMTVGKGFAGRAAMLGKPVVVGRSYSDNMFDPFALECDGIRSICSVPIVAKEQVLGVLCVGNRDERDFDDQYIPLLQGIASQTGMAIENSRMYEKSVERAATDELTGLYNRRYFMEHVDKEVSRARRKKTSAAMLLIDMDGLKGVNDRYGHHCGSEMIRTLAQTITNTARTSDMAARLGGDEFVMLAYDTNMSEATELAERLRSNVASSRTQVPGGELTMSASIGVACFPENASDSDELLRKADEAMYEAKKAGKNRVRVATTRPSAEIPRQRSRSSGGTRVKPTKKPSASGE